MNLNIKHASLVLAEVAMVAALAACGGANGDAAQAGADSVAGTDTSAQDVQHDAQAEAVHQQVTLTVTASEGGRVTSSPAGIDCTAGVSQGCSANFTRKTHVTLTATASQDYAFSNWSGACTGTDGCSGNLGTSVSVGSTFAKVGGGGGSSAPVVNYTDALSGPTTGGENNAGAYLSIFGNNFGSASGLGTTTKVYIGGVEVANYRYLGQAKVGSKLGLQQLTVQVGNLGLPMGTAEPVKVVVNGTASNTDQTFTPNPGRILFVSLTGDDTTAVPGDITHPYRHLQTATGGGAHGVMHAGDHVVIRGGDWNDTGMDGAWFRFRYPQQEGTAPTGASNTGWIHFTAYPGPINGNAMEDVHYSTPPNVKGGIQGANSAYFGTTGDYVSISNLRMDVDANAESDAAPVNVQYSAGPWRVVNNELGPWPSKIAAKAAGVSGHGNGTTVLGNYIHDIACTGAMENHGIYADSGAMNWNVGYNWILNIPGGNLIQFFDNVGLAGNNYTGYPPNWKGFTGMMVHHNWMENGGKYGLNMADGIVSGQIWNNVVKGVTYAGLRFNTISKNMDMTIAYNTFYDNDRLASGSGNAQVLNTWGNYNPTGIIRIYDNIFAAGPGTLKTSSYYENMGADDFYLDFKRNLYFDNSYGWGNFARDPQAVLGNPTFKNAASSDLRLASGSLAIDAGTQSVPMTVGDDMTRLVKRPQGGAPDIGAYEKVF
jgi:hypothetical protein